MPACQCPGKIGASQLIGGAGKWVLFPALFYLGGFALLTWPLITEFSTLFYHCGGDGWQNVWNIWWVNKAVTDFHQLPWHTRHLHFPYGTTLIGHTLNPFNGFLGVLLHPFLTLIQVHNAIILFAFVVGGLGAFMLAHHFLRAYWPALFAGFVFTFSSFHFMHLEGHLQLVSLEWLPFCLLYIYRLITEPRLSHAALAALLMLLVTLCDYYYCFFCVLAGFLILGWELYRQRRLFFCNRQFLTNYATFVILVLVTCGPIFGKLVHHNRNDPFSGAHSPAEFSLEALAPVIPGLHWRFANLTRPYWSRLTQADYYEGDAHLGVVVLFLAAWAWWRSGRFAKNPLSLFAVVFLVFLGLSLGTELRVLKWSHPFSLMPYRILEKIIPPLKLSGCPMRMMVMVTLAAAVLAAHGLQLLWADAGRKRLWLVPVLLAVVAAECWPAPVHRSLGAVPQYVNVLRGLPQGAVFDDVGDPCNMLYFATQHDHPVALGYISRCPNTVMRRDHLMLSILAVRDYDRLRAEFKMRYLVTRENTVHPALRKVNEHTETCDGLRRDGREWVYIYEFVEPVTNIGQTAYSAPTP